MPSIGSLELISDDTSTWRPSTPRAPGFKVSPQSFGRGNFARSNRRTRTPARARMVAASAPAGPAPAMTTSSTGAIRSAQDERAVLRAEPKAIAQRRFGLRGAAGVRDEIEIAVGIRIALIDRRRQEVVRKRQRGGHHAGGAAGALRVADHRFG